MSISFLNPSNPGEFRQVLGAVPTAVAVIASAVADTPVGVAVGSFVSVSLDPPLVGFFIARTSSTWPVIQETGGFCASILSSDQERLSRTFAQPGADRFGGCAWNWTERHRPAIADAVAWLDCDISSVVRAGDHDLVLGAVLGMAMSSPAAPLLFVNGGYTALA